MLKISFNTRKLPENVVSEAEKFFERYGLRTRDKGECCLEMEGGGGYVRLDIIPKDRSEVTLECREWEGPVKEFVQKQT